MQEPVWIVSLWAATLATVMAYVTQRIPEMVMVRRKHLHVGLLWALAAIWLLDQHQVAQSFGHTESMPRSRAPSAGRGLPRTTDAAVLQRQLDDVGPQDHHSAGHLRCGRGVRRSPAAGRPGANAAAAGC